MDYTNALLTTADMQQAEQYADSHGIPYLQMMENAGNAIFASIIQNYKKQPVVILCGPGNNGGDGFVVARLLKEEGWPVQVAGEVVGKSHDSGIMMAKWQEPILPLTPDILKEEPLIIDALFGAGLMRPLEGNYKNIIEAVNNLKLRVVAVDVPSGVDGNTGEVLGIAAQAEHTVTFLRKRPAHLLLPGKALCGKVLVADISIPEACLEEIKPMLFENTPHLWQLPQISTTGHKYSRGHAAILGRKMPGAPRIAARAARRAGSGLVTLAGPKDIYPILATEEAGALLHHLDTEKDLNELLENPKITGWLIGPGYGVNNKTCSDVLSVLKIGTPTVLDADALTSFEHEPQVLFNNIQKDVVLTPHEGEFKRLFPDLNKDKLSNALSAARRSGSVVVLKGSDTIIASPCGNAAINSNAPSTLATAGSGDALAGIITGLLAQGMDIFEASCAGVYLHAESANLFGEGLIAEDIPEQIPGVLKKLKSNAIHS